MSASTRLIVNSNHCKIIMTYSLDEAGHRQSFWSNKHGYRARLRVAINYIFSQRLTGGIKVATIVGFHIGPISDETGAGVIERDCSHVGCVKMIPHLAARASHNQRYPSHPSKYHDTLMMMISRIADVLRNRFTCIRLLQKPDKLHHHSGTVRAVYTGLG